jgi:hypothetical protein
MQISTRKRIDSYGWFTLCALLFTLNSCDRTADTANMSDSLNNRCTPQPTDSEDIKTVSSWMISLQYRNPEHLSDGSIRVHHTPGHIAPNGDAYFHVIPYFSNMALLGLLNTPVANKLEITERGIRWYLNHLNKNGSPPGVVYDHWYLADGTGETTCPPGLTPSLCNHDDASDSYAATLLGVTWAYYQAGGNAAFLQTAGNKEIFEQIAQVILTLQQPDGLTWAKDSFRVKYLMDNSEVYWGLISMAELERVVFGDEINAQQYKAAAESVQRGINQSLFNPNTGLYRIAKFENNAVEEANLNVWYPGTVAIAWPHLFGVTGNRSEKALAQMAALNESWDGSPHPDWTETIVDPTGFVWPSIGQAALLTGDCDRAQRHATFVKNKKFPDFAWPFDVSEGGWLLMTLAPAT